MSISENNKNKAISSQLASPVRNISEATAERPSTEGLGDAATRGETFIEEDVVSIIARTASEHVEGVHRIGESSLRALSPFDYGVDIREVTSKLRQRIAREVDKMACREVVEVNINVVGLHMPEEEQDDEDQPRVI